MKKILTTSIILILLFSLYGSTLAQTSPQSEKVKSLAVKYAGSDATVEVKMLSGSKTKGKITTITTDAFMFQSDKGQPTAIRYDEVAEIKKKSKLGTGAWIAIGAAAAGAAIVIGFISMRCRNEPGSC